MTVRPRWFGYLGLVLLVGTLAATAVAGRAATAAQVVEWSLTSLAGLAYALGGFPSPLRERVGWHRLAGLGNVLLGVGLTAGTVLGGTVGTVVGVATAAGGLLLVAMGVDYLRGGEWFAVDPEAG